MVSSSVRYCPMALRDSLLRLMRFTFSIKAIVFDRVLGPMMKDEEVECERSAENGMLKTESSFCVAAIMDVEKTNVEEKIELESASISDALLLRLVH